MTKIKAIEKLTKCGYRVTTCINSGNKIAIKGQQSYRAKSFNGLIKILFN